MTTDKGKSTVQRGGAKPKGKMVATFPKAVDPEKAAAMAKMALRPSVNAAAVMASYTSPLGEQDFGELVTSLSEGIDGLWGGDMKRAEAMLYAQAHALQAMFMNFARRAQVQEYQKNLESFFRMALKAQNQCRMTLETLATIKNPPVMFAKQANINNGGQQQVNNGACASDGSVAPNQSGAVRAGVHAHAENSKPDQTELLEASDGQRLDTRTASKAGRADPQLATVGKVHRAAQR